MPVVTPESSYGAGNRLTLLPTYSAVVGEDVSIWSTDSGGVVGTASAHQVTVSGTVFGGFSGIRLGDSNLLDKGEKVVVNVGGSVLSDPLTFPLGGAAIMLVAAQSEVINNGLISGRAGIVLGGLGAGVSKITNSGDIIGNVWGILVDAPSTETISLLNTGVIRGNSVAAYQSGTSAVDLITNKGSIIGLVALEGGNDLYDGFAGSVTGVVQGGAGNDRMRAGAFIDTLDGGAGIDTLDFSPSAGVNFSLTNAGFATGVAAGDIYTGFENLTGSLLGADHLIADAARNVLVGQGGNDTLDGAGERDVLTGGLGADSLIGGAGNDIFVFLKPSEGGDHLADFSRATGNADYLRISAAGFGGGLTRGTLAEAKFRTSLGNRGLDKDDRFIFRSTDKTLWFDVDGSGRKGPVLIVTVDSDVPLMSSDLFIV